MMDLAVNDNSRSVMLNGAIYQVVWDDEHGEWMGDLLVEMDGEEPEFMAFWIDDDAVSNLEVF